MQFQGFDYAVSKISSVGISNKRIVVTNSITENNSPLAFGNAVRVQEKLETAAGMITYNPDIDIPKLQEFATQNL